MLSHIQDITYSRSEEEYTRKYSSLCDVMPDRVKEYYDTMVSDTMVLEMSGWKG